jgi:hypothetical protein
MHPNRMAEIHRGWDMSIAKNRIMTAAEVAKHLGITASGVDKVEQAALNKLRRSATLFLMYAELQSDRRSQNIGTLMQDEYGEGL